MCFNSDAQNYWLLVFAKIDANATHWTIALDFTDIVLTDDTVSVQFVTQLLELFR